MEFPALRGRSILVVEDEPLIGWDIREALEKAGANVTATTTVRHALILIDHDVPVGSAVPWGTTGYSLQNAGDGYIVPLVFASRNWEKGIMLLAFAAGPMGLLLGLWFRVSELVAASMMTVALCLLIAPFAGLSPQPGRLPKASRGMWP
jgi:CheY-like chemotaxis protein